MSSGWSPVAGGPVPFSSTPHLEAVSSRAADLSARLQDHVDGDLAVELQDEAVVASLRLDGSPIRRPPGPTAAPAPLTGEGERAGGWLEILARDDHGDERVTALEYHGLRSCLDDHDLADAILEDPMDVLVELHRRATAGLVEPEHQGAWRSRDLAVHDASAGQVLLRPAAPLAVPPRMDALARWIETYGDELPATITSGVVHLELLLSHPFESANGRLARTAARLVLRARSLDERGVVPVELVLLDEPIGYLREAAATQRRRDLTVWLERWSEALAEGARRALRRAGAEPETPPERAVAFVDDRGSGAFTLVDYRDAAGVGIDEAQGDLLALLDAGRVRRLLGSRGLRFVIT